MPFGAAVDVLNFLNIKLKFKKKLKDELYEDGLLTKICFRGEVIQFRASVCKPAAVV